MKTKLCRPILVETKESTNIFKDHTGLFHSNLNLQTGHSINSSVIGYNLILISLDPNEKIEVGDKYYDSHNDLILAATAQSDHNVYQYKKVIATQFQLPEEYIQRFVEGYNSGNIKDVEIEMEGILPPVGGQTCGGGAVVYFIGYKPKLTNGFVTIVDKKESILYTEEEVIDYMAEFISYVFVSWLNDITPINVVEWFKQNKKK